MSDKKKFTGFIGTVMTASVPGRNGNIYPRELLEKAVEEAQEAVSSGWLCGMVDPSADRPELRKISHKITKLKMEGDDVVAEVAILDTPEGVKLRRLVEMGEALAIDSVEAKISMTPMGTYKTSEDGVISDFRFTAINISDDQK